MKKKCLLTIAFISLFSTANAETVISMYGDQDGFGIDFQPNQSFYVNYPALLKDDSADDGTITDEWVWGDQSWSHTYDISGMDISSASIEILTLGQGWNGISELMIDGNYIGDLTDGDSSGTSIVTNWARLDVFDLSRFKNLLNGANTVTVNTYRASDDDRWALDYSKLTINSANGETLDCSKWDANNNNKFDMADIIYGLQILSGIRSNLTIVECTGNSSNEHCIPNCDNGWNLVSEGVVSSGQFWTHIGLCSQSTSPGYEIAACSGSSNNDHCQPNCETGWNLISDVPISSLEYWTHIGLCSNLPASEYKFAECTGSGINEHCLPDCGAGWSLIEEVPVSSGDYWTHLGLCKKK